MFTLCFLYLDRKCTKHIYGKYLSTVFTINNNYRVSRSRSGSSGAGSTSPVHFSEEVPGTRPNVLRIPVKGENRVKVVEESEELVYFHSFETSDLF